MVESYRPMVSPFLQGVYFFTAGIRLIFKPGLKRYIVIPIIFNAILLVFIFGGLAFVLYPKLHSFLVEYPSWIILVFGWLFWFLYSIISLMISTLVFTVLTNIIASPFYGLLAEAAAKSLHRAQGLEYYDPSQNQHWLKTALTIAPRTLAREARKLLYFLPWIFLCLLFLIFPFTWPIFPFVWWAVLAWILAIQYIDYQPDNEHVPFKQVLVILKQNTMMLFGFGSCLSLAMMIPGANLFVPPAAVAGGTALWFKLGPKSGNPQPAHRS